MLQKKSKLPINLRDITYKKNPVFCLTEHHVWPFFEEEIHLFRSSHQRCSIKKRVLRNFTEFTGKHLCQSLFFKKVLGLSPATLLKKRLRHRCYRVNFVKLLRTHFLQNTSKRLLLFVSFFEDISSLTFLKPRKKTESNSQCFLVTGKVLFYSSIISRDIRVLKAAVLFKHAWPFSGNEKLKG